MRDPIVDDECFEPFDALLDEAMASTPLPATSATRPAARIGPPLSAGGTEPLRRWFAAAVVLLGIATVAGTLGLRRHSRSDAGAALPARQEPKPGGTLSPRDAAEFTRAVAEARALVVTTQTIETLAPIGEVTYARDAEPRFVVGDSDLGEWRRLLGSLSAPARGATDDVVALVVAVDLADGRRMEVVAHSDCAALVLGPRIAPLALPPELLDRLRHAKAEILRRRRLDAGVVDDVAELEQLVATTRRIQCRAMPADDVPARLGRFRALQGLTLLRDVDGARPDGAVLAALAALPGLEELHLFAGGLRDDSLRALAALPQLRRLAIWGADGITGAGFAGLQRLEILSLDGVGFDITGLRAIARLPHLAELTLGV